MLSGDRHQSTPLLSIIIPTRNYAPYVGQAIRSALGQGYRPVEVIAVDDGSTDDTPRVLSEFATAVRVLRLDGRGVSAARNAGLAEARGHYVLFLDSDDVLIRDGPPRQAELLARSPGIDVVVGDWYVYDVESKRAARRACQLDPGAAIPQLLRSNAIATPSVVMLRRRALQAVGGFDMSLHFTADWELWLRLARRGHQFARVSTAVTVYRTHRHSMSANVDLAIRDTVALVGRSFSDPTLPDSLRPIEPEARLETLLYLARLCFHAGEAQRGAECLRQAARWAPDGVKTLAFYQRLVDEMGELRAEVLPGISDAVLALEADPDERRDARGARRGRALRHLTMAMLCRNAGERRRALRQLAIAIRESWRTVSSAPQRGWSIRLLVPRRLTALAHRLLRMAVFDRSDPAAVPPDIHRALVEIADGDAHPADPGPDAILSDHRPAE